MESISKAYCLKQELDLRILRAIEIELTEDSLQMADAIIWNKGGTDFFEILERVKKILSNAYTS